MSIENEQNNISNICNNSGINYGRVVGITIIEQWAQVATAYQIEQVKKCARSLPPGESFYGLLIPVNYSNEGSPTSFMKRSQNFDC